MSVGGLWLAQTCGSDGSGGRLAFMDKDGEITIVADSPGWLDYPAQMAFGNGFGLRYTMFITNVGLNLGHPNVISLKVRTAGLRLPADF